MPTEQREKEIALFNETFFEEYLHQDMFGMPLKISNYWLNRMEEHEKAVREEIKNKSVNLFNSIEAYYGNPRKEKMVYYDDILEVLSIINPTNNQE